MNINKILFLGLILIIVAVSISTGQSSAATECSSVKCPPLVGDKNEGDIPLTNSDHVYHINGNLTIGNNIPGNKTGVIFVDGNLLINPSSKKLTDGGANSGLVFVVKGDVNIDKDVTQVDAVIISEGTICTAYDGTSCLDGNTPTPQLEVNGSLISLNGAADAIKFRRSLGETGALKDSTDPAEKINHQVKYLVILRDLLSDTYQKWSEIP